MPSDVLGNNVEVGDLVAAAVSMGTSAVLRVGVVEKLGKKKVYYQRSTPTATIRWWTEAGLWNKGKPNGTATTIEIGSGRLFLIAKPHDGSDLPKCECGNPVEPGYEGCGQCV